MPNEYDVVVIGSGTGGYVAAIRAAQLGLKTAVVERAPALGGTCLNWGCIPTKALLEHAHALKVAQNWKEWGLTLGQVLRPDSGQAFGIDMGQVQARKDKIVKSLTGGVELLFRKNKIDWIKGSGRLAGKGQVEITEGDKRTLTATKEIIVATGSQARSVPGIELDRTRIITSDEAIGLKEIPKSIAIMGSGAVGVEFASIFRRFGSDVTLIELLPRLVPGEDEAVSAELERSFKKQGIAILTGTKVTSARNTGGGVDLEAQTADGKATKISAEYLLVATGRGPVTSGLGAEEAGLHLERGYVRVDEQYRTSVPGISAIGDVITFDKPGHAQLAHLSSAEGIALAERIAGHEFRADQLRSRSGLHVLRSGDRQRRPDRNGSQGARLRRPDGQLQVQRPRPRAHRRRDGRLREDRRREEIRRGARRPHHRSARDRTGRRGDAGAAPRVHCRRADSHHPRASDDVGGSRRSGARHARRGHPCVRSGQLPVPSLQKIAAGRWQSSTSNCYWQLVTGNCLLATVY